MFTSCIKQESISWIILNAPPEHATETWLAMENILSPQEKATFAALRFPKRRHDWLLGRYASKKLLLDISPPSLTCSIQQLTIVSNPQGAPYILFPNQTQLEGCLTISHSEGTAFCAWTPLPNLQIGADIEIIAPHPQYFIEDYFTPHEIAQCFQSSEALRPSMITAIWSAKEAVLKALQQGLAWDTRQVEIDLSPARLEIADQGTWGKASITLPHIKGKSWQLWIQRHQAFIATLACLK